MIPPPTADCPDCHWQGDINICEHDIEQETWELPSYLIAQCPMCEKWNVRSIPQALLE